MEEIIHLGGVGELFKFLAMTSVLSLPPAYIFTCEFSAIPATMPSLYHHALYPYEIVAQ